MTDFFQKYTPTTLDDVFMDEYDLDTLKAFSSGDLSGSIILHGPPGTGKSTAAQIVASKRGSGNPRICNAASMTAETFDSIENEGNHVSLGDEHDMVIINEADKLSDKLKGRLTELCDPLYATRNIILTTNNIDGLSPALQDRAEKIEIPCPPPSEWAIRAKEILDAEGVIKSVDAVEALLKSGGSVRDYMRLLEKAVNRHRKQQHLHQRQTGGTMP